MTGEAWHWPVVAHLHCRKHLRRSHLLLTTQQLLQQVLLMLELQLELEQQLHQSYSQQLCFAHLCCKARAMGVTVDSPQ